MKTTRFPMEFSSYHLIKWPTYLYKICCDKNVSSLSLSSQNKMLHKCHRVELRPTDWSAAGWVLFKVIMYVPGLWHPCMNRLDWQSVTVMYRVVVLHCLPQMNGWTPSLLSMLVVVYCHQAFLVSVAMPGCQRANTVSPLLCLVCHRVRTRS